MLSFLFHDREMTLPVISQRDESMMFGVPTRALDTHDIFIQAYE